ncbi:hypothetical protein FQN54_008987 [Arachnomyces sp. PD_36]|nr:hypothetical protein FQN54_008987 [Arachnomyces sp. PD_36]
MAEAQKPVDVAGAENPKTSVNADAEKDVQSVLAELKGGEAAKPAESTEKEDPEPTENKAAEANGNGAAKDEAAEEARIIAAAAKLGEDTEKKQESKGTKDTKQSGHSRFNPRVRGNAGKRVNYRDNIKSDLTSGQQTSDPNAIRTQLEFYFSDSNLPMDKFLLSKVGGSKNNPVELSILHSFKRMRRFQPFSAIVDAVKTSDKLELANDDTCVRRKEPLPESVNDSVDPTVARVFEDKALHKSIYAKGFGAEGPSTQFDIEAFFAQFGPTSAIRLRRANDRTFKGSVFVEFDTEDTQKAFLALDPKPKWKGDTELLIKSKKDYCDEKVKEIAAGRLKPSNNIRGRGGHRGRGGRGGGNDTRDWRDRRSEDQKHGHNGSQRGRGRGNGQPQTTRPRQEYNDRGVPIVRDTRNDTLPPALERALTPPKDKKSVSPPQSTTKTKTTPPPAPSTSTSEATAGQKRAREEEGASTASGSKDAGDNDHPAKKVDVKDG